MTIILYYFSRAIISCYLLSVLILYLLYYHFFNNTYHISIYTNEFTVVVHYNTKPREKKNVPIYR